MKSIQSSLTVYIIVGTTLMLVAAGLAVDYVLRQQLEQEFDRALLSKAMTLISLTEQDLGVVEFDFAKEFMPEFEAEERSEYFELWLQDGSRLAHSPSLGEAKLPRTNAAMDQPEFRHIVLPDGRKGRLVEVMFVPRVDEESEDSEEQQTESPEPAEIRSPDAVPRLDIRAVIVLAKGIEELQELISRTRTILLFAFVSLMLALALLARSVVSYGLRPLKQITREVQSLDADKLHLRLAQADTEELAPITGQLNHLLDRLEGAFQREKRFSGNVAHELRTPIAELRTMSEVGREWPEEREMVEGFFGDLVNLADDMERTVTNLLMLARLDAGTQAVTLGPVNLKDLTAGVWRRLQAAAADRRIDLMNRIDSDLNVTTDKDKLGLILINIFSNAISYSPERSSIVVEARETQVGIELNVSNTAQDLNEQDLPLLFERFWRKDQARSGSQHAGLGLSLVKALAEVLNLRIAPLLRAPDQFTMSLSDLTPA